VDSEDKNNLKAGPGILHGSHACRIALGSKLCTWTIDTVADSIDGMITTCIRDASGERTGESASLIGMLHVYSHVLLTCFSFIFLTFDWMFEVPS
jgi:hypothetical protein